MKLGEFLDFFANAMPLRIKNKKMILALTSKVETGEIMTSLWFLESAKSKLLKSVLDREIINWDITHSRLIVWMTKIPNTVTKK